MRIYKYIIPILSISILLSACIPKLNTEIDSEDESTPEIVTAVIPSDEANYQMKLPYTPSKTKGTYASFSNRLDVNRLELGLLELAQKKFDPENYLFQEGQILSTDDVEDWLGRYHAEQNTLGLNPEQGSNILIHILEHDYISVGTQEVQGMVIGLSINPEIKRKEEGVEKKVTLTREEQIIKLDEYAAKIVQRIRAKEITTPILIAGFVLEPSVSLIPGHFIRYGYSEEGADQIKAWEEIQESYVLYPGRLSKTEAEKAVGANFADFQLNVQGFFSHYAGLIGLGRFLSDELVELTITVTAEYSSKTEVIALTQYIAGILPEYFSENVKINVYVKSIDQTEAIFIRPIKGDPFFHVYR